MTEHKNRLGTAEDTKATVSLEHQATPTLPVKQRVFLPPINQLVFDEVGLFFDVENQAQFTPADVEFILLSENEDYGLKGVRAYRTIQTLPSAVIARCIVER